jgi:hypothetical protein
MIGAHVVWSYDGRDLIGDVVGIVEGFPYLVVRHFNGELWPACPHVDSVAVLQREYSEGVEND